MLIFKNTNKKVCTMDLCFKTFRAVRSFVLLLISALSSVGALAEIAHVSISDVSSRAGSLSWVSDDPINSISARVYADESGSLEITSQLDIVSVSGEVNGAGPSGGPDVCGASGSSMLSTRAISNGNWGMV